ncbi:hypothetical protein NDU88_007022 [Pleurodeles waltl]|uniref:Secreted protein n=1 Tax=Pleurodeles waltl TaxID=8319 RepID=A0AAV7QNM1_PLEWA|nr:hypothetical protein NDU88_007022 [Pleurodeles waltl]
MRVVPAPSPPYLLYWCGRRWSISFLGAFCCMCSAAAARLLPAGCEWLGWGSGDGVSAVPGRVCGAQPPVAVEFALEARGVVLGTELPRI